MKLNHLTQFVLIAEEGQIGLAAERIGMTQPALTKNLNSLETAVGAKLFERTRTGVQLSPAGRLLLPRARNILRITDDAQRELNEFAIGAIGQLRVGVGPMMAEFLLPQIVTELMTNFPKVELKVMSALNDILFENLRENNLDLVVSALPDIKPTDFEQAILMHDELVVAVNTNHPLTKKKRVTLQELSREHWVLSRPGVLGREWLDHAFKTHGLAPPHTPVEADSAATILSIVAKTQLITFQSRSNLTSFIRRNMIAEVRCTKLQRRRTIGVSWRKGAYLPQISKLFISSLRKVTAS